MNDTYGHGAGDRLLEQFADLLRHSVRQSDYIIRWGGEEFLIVARATTWEEAGELAQRLLLNINSAEFQLSADAILHKTCSIGFARYPFFTERPEMLSWEQVIDRADRALYAAKRSGRNCWIGLRGATTSDALGEQDPEAFNVTIEGEDCQYSTSLPAGPAGWSKQEEP